MWAEVGPGRRVRCCGGLSGGCEEESDRLVWAGEFVPLGQRSHCCRIVVAVQYATAKSVGRLIRGSLGLAVPCGIWVAVGVVALKGAIGGCCWITQNADNDEPRCRDRRLHDATLHATQMPASLRISRREGRRSKASEPTCASIWQMAPSAARNSADSRARI